VAALLETISVASIMPFLAVLATPDLGATDPRLQKIVELLGAEDREALLTLLGVGVLSILVVANTASGATAWQMLRFANREGHNLALRLLESYLLRPYTFYLGRNTSELQKNIFTEVQKVTVSVLIPGVQMIAKATVVVFILALLAYSDPLLTAIIAAVLLGSYLIIFRAFRPILQITGSTSVDAGTQRAKHALEALTGIKEIKLLGRERDFLRLFERPSLDWADAQARAHAVGQLPRFAVETVALGLVLVAAIYLLRTSGDVAGVLPMLGLYAFAGYRIMPALQQVFAAWSTFRYARAAMDVVLRDLRSADPMTETIPPRDADVLKFRRAVSCSALSFRYPGTQTWALRDVTLVIARNSSVGIVGATGSGKSTLIDVLMGLLVPDEGSVCVDDVRVDRASVRAWRRNIGHVPQQIFLSDDTIARNVALGLRDELIDQERVVRACRIARLHDFVSGLPLGYRTIVGDRGIRLSGGQRQRIGLARALYGDPEVLVLDEATSALDNATENAVLEALRSLAGSKTIITIAHRLSTVKGCGVLYVMHEGRIVEFGSYGELIESSQRFRALASALEA
jgi:ABC-type bacteriocin/lantibiotic exporter with double-glycine peptidase domain